MKKQPLLVEITDGNELIGKLTPDQFRKGFPTPHTCRFLTDQVTAFNNFKRQINEPERARIVLNK